MSAAVCLSTLFSTSSVFSSASSLSHLTLGVAAEEKWTPLTYDPGTLIWTWVVFGAVVFLLAKFAWRPLITALEAREKKVADGLEEADRARAEAARISADFEKQVKEARAEAHRIAEQARASAEKLAAEIKVQARDEAERMIERARSEISLAQRQAMEDIRVMAVDLAIEAAGTVLQKSVDKEDNRRIAASVIESLQASPEGSR